MEQLTIVSGLFKLALNRLKQFTVRNLTVARHRPDARDAVGLRVRRRDRRGGRPRSCCSAAAGCGSAPSDPAERTQVRIFSGEEQLTADFDAAFVRVPPAEFAGLFAGRRRDAAARVVPSDVRRAADVFDDYIGQTLQHRSQRPEPRPLVARARHQAI